MTISYNDTIPNTNNRPSADQPIMLANAVALKTIWAVDHITFGDTSANNGYHDVIHFKNQGTTDPAVTPNIGQLYTKTVSGDEQLFYESGLGTISQLTGNTSVFATNGYTTLPNGLLLQWGKITSATKNSTVTVNFATSNIDFPTNCFNITGVIGRGTSSAPITLIVVNRQSFTYYLNTSTSQTLDFYWFAIGN